jgi:peptidoglycan/LPS O-acetylase OafA/YrhL
MCIGGVRPGEPGNRGVNPQGLELAGSRFAAAWMTSVLRFHSPVGFPWTLNIFALLAAAWLKLEVAFRKTVPPAGLLESAGLWSYSLYLLHLVAGTWFDKIVPPVANEWLNWLLICAFVFGCSFLFYLLVERPSHFIARRVSQVFRPGPRPSRAMGEA